MFRPAITYDAMVAWLGRHPLKPESLYSVWWLSHGSDFLRVMVEDSMIWHKKRITSDLFHFLLFSVFTDCQKLRNPQIVESLQEQCMELLNEYCRARFPEQKLRFSKILFRLSAVRSITTETRDCLIRQKSQLQGEGKIDSFVLEMLDGWVAMQVPWLELWHVVKLFTHLSTSHMENCTTPCPTALHLSTLCPLSIYQKMLSASRSTMQCIESMPPTSAELICLHPLPHRLLILLLAAWCSLLQKDYLELEFVRHWILVSGYFLVSCITCTSCMWISIS